MTLFSTLGLKPEIAKAVEELGFQQPTPIQEQSIPVLLTGTRDFMGLAQTGTGKTAAFGLPLINHLNFSIKTTQGLILCPTRELCMQVKSDLEKYSSHTKGAHLVAVYGGASISGQISEIKRGAQIIVATPGRLMDLMERKVINLAAIRYVVLDEADEMLNMGFRDDIEFILSHVTGEKNVWLFSATMPREVRQIAERFMVDPFELTVGHKNTTAENIKHVYYITRANHKFDALKRVIDYQPDIFGIIFAQTKIETQEIAEKLIREGYNADALHGDLSQQQRDKVMNRFRQRSLQLLVATDVAARGIDVNDITHVINYSIPDELESYTHRSGRTARAGKKGISITIVNPKEVGKLRQMERLTKAKFEKEIIPSGVDVCEKQLFHIINNVHKVEVNDSAIEPYLGRIMEELQDLTKEELIKKFASVEFNRFLNYYKNAPDLNYDASQKEFSSRDSGDFTRVFVSVGTMDGFDNGSLFRFVLDCTNYNKTDIGRISLKNAYAFVEVSSSLAEQFIDNMRNQQYRGRKIRAEVSGEEPRSRDGGRKFERGGDRGGFGGGRRNGGGSGSESRGRGGYGRSERGGSSRSSFHGKGEKSSFGGSRKDKFSKNKGKSGGNEFSY